MNKKPRARARQKKRTLREKDGSENSRRAVATRLTLTKESNGFTRAISIIYMLNGGGEPRKVENHRVIMRSARTIAA